MTFLQQRLAEVSGKRWSVTVLAALVITSGCRPEGTYQQGDQVARWSIGDPIMTIGTRDEGPAAFSPIGDVAFSPDGDVYVLLPQEQVVRWFDQNGDLLGSIGGPGKGPGEFSRPRELALLGDTLVVLDNGTRRASFFSNGTLLRSESFPDLQSVATQRTVRVVGYVSESRALIAAQIGVPLQPEPTDTAFLAVLDDSGPARLAHLNAEYLTGLLTRMNGDAIAAMRPIPQPFTHASLWSISATGAEVVVVDQAEAAESSTFEVTAVRTMGGDTVFHVTLPHVPSTIPSGLVDSISSALAIGGFSAEEVREAMYVPASYPPVSKVFHAADALIWIGGPKRPGEPVDWRILSESGIHLADLDTPHGFDVQWADGSAVWGIETDEFDVPYLVKRPVVRN